MNRAISLLTQLLNTHTPTVSPVSVSSLKPTFTGSGVDYFPRVTSESVGVSGDHLASFLEEVRREPTLNMHNITVLRHGKVVAEATFGDQDPQVWKMTFSACKSITALAVGMLVDEGKLSLDDRLTEFFPDKITPVMRLRFKEITIRHLLTMTTGASFNEAESATETDWIRGYFSGTVSPYPGKVFSYNSLNTYMLAAVVTRVTGGSLMEYLQPRLWGPLGITQVFWETCPEGIEKGGWGLYLSREDLAKIGQLILQRGMWNGVRLVSDAWIIEATRFQTETPLDCGDFNYGYQFWCSRQGDSFLMNGMLGQNVWGFPGSDILLVSHAGNDELFQQSRYFRIAQQYFDTDFPDVLPENEEGQKRLAGVIAACRFPQTKPANHAWWKFWKTPRARLPLLCERLNNVTLTATSSNAASAGLLPMLLQTTQNNYATGLCSLGFTIREDQFLFTYTQSDETYQFPVGFDVAEVSDLSIGGVPYRVAVRGRAAKNEDEEEVLIVTLNFLETPCTRVLKIVFGKTETVLRQTERPGESFLQQLLAEVRQRLDKNPLIGAAAQKLDDGYVQFKIESLMSPKIQLVYQKTEESQ